MELDVRITLPDALIEAGGVEPTRAPWLEVDGVGRFVRCLLPIRLDGEMTLTFGTWLRVAPVAQEGGDIFGTLANAIKPWGETILGAEVTARVLRPEHIPYVVDSPDETVKRLLTEVWSRDEVLGCLAHELPVPIRARVSDEWSIERGAGFRVRIHDGSLRLIAPGRTVILDVYGIGDTTPDGFLATMTADRRPPEGELTERDAVGELRHAYWITDGAQHELYSWVIRPGDVLQVVCIHDDPAELDWAIRTWRSVRYHGERVK